MGDYEHYRIPVPPEFEQVFSHFYYAANSSDLAVRKKLLPSYQTIIVFNFGAPVSFITGQQNEVMIEQCIVLGPVKKAFDYQLPPGSQMLAANFVGDAFFRFFGQASVTNDFAAHPDTILQQDCFTGLWAELKAIENINKRIDHILEFCRPYLRYRHPFVLKMTDFYGDHVNPVKAISETNKVTERTVQLNYKKRLGFSAKELSRYQRFLKAIRLLQTMVADGTNVDWFTVIDECGFYDQSQLVHDFQHYLSLTPSQYLKLEQDICSPK